MDTADSLHPIVEVHSLPQAGNPGPYDADDNSFENERVPDQSGQGTPDGQHGSLISPVDFNDHGTLDSQNFSMSTDDEAERSTEEPRINSYRHPYPVPGINVRVLDPTPRSSGSRTNNPVEAEGNNSDETRNNTFESPNSTANSFENGWQNYSRRELRGRAVAISRSTPNPHGPYPQNSGPSQLEMDSLEQQPAGEAPTSQHMSQSSANTPAPARTHMRFSTNGGILPSLLRARARARSRPGTNLHYSPPVATDSPAVSQQQHRGHHNQDQNQTVNTTTIIGNSQHTTSPTHGQRNRRRARHAAEADQRPQFPTSVSDMMSRVEFYDQFFEHARRHRPGTSNIGASLMEVMRPSTLPSKGLDNQNDGRPEPKDAEELQVNLECKACMSQLVDTVILPCGHAVLCRWCADQHMPSSRTDSTRPKGEAICPMCRAAVMQKFRIYLS